MDWRNGIQAPKNKEKIKRPGLETKKEAYTIAEIYGFNKRSHLFSDPM